MNPGGCAKYACLLLAPGEARLIIVWLRGVTEIADDVVCDEVATSAHERFHGFRRTKLFAFASFLGAVTIFTFVAHTVRIFSRGLEPPHLDHVRQPREMFVSKKS